MAKTAKVLQKNKGCVADTNPKSGSKTLTKETAETIKSFYRREDISRIMAGKKDFISVYNTELKTKKHEQKKTDSL